MQVNEPVPIAISLLDHVIDLLLGELQAQRRKGILQLAMIDLAVSIGVHLLEELLRGCQQALRVVRRGAIGDTLKSMEAKHAVEEELESEVATNCEVGEWSPYGKCSASCDGGKQERTREVMTQNQNGGAPCPVLSENIVCNSDSCASEAYKRRATRRKLTAAEHKKEGIMNRRQETLAMRSNSVFEMKKRTREVMRKLVHTELAVVQLPGEEGERTPEQQIRKSLQAAMAKNSVTDAMKTYEATKHAAADTTSQQSADNEQFKRATSKPTGNGNEKH